MKRVIGTTPGLDLDQKALVSHLGGIRLRGLDPIP